MLIHLECTGTKGCVSGCRYLFNAGEGFQRYCVEHKIKLARMSGVLATRISTEAIGGLPGVSGAHMRLYDQVPPKSWQSMHSHIIESCRLVPAVVCSIQGRPLFLIVMHVVLIQTCSEQGAAG